MRVFLKAAVIEHKRLSDITLLKQHLILPELETIFLFFFLFYF